MWFLTFWICSGLIALMIAYQIVFELRDSLENNKNISRKDFENLSKLASTDLNFQNVLTSILLGPIHMVMALYFWLEVKKFLKRNK